MRLSLSPLAFAATMAAVLLGSVQVQADTLIIDNAPGSTADTNPAYATANLNPNLGSGITDSFTLTSSTTLTRAQFSLWSNAGDHPNTLTWGIDTSAHRFGNSLGGGSDSIGSTLTESSIGSSGGSTLWSVVADLTGNPTLSAGTYFLTLSSASEVGNAILPILWDDSLTPPLGTTAYAGNVGNGVTPEAFQLYGNVSLQSPAAPEPGSLALLGSLGLTGAAFLRRRLNRGRVTSDCSA